MASEKTMLEKMKVLGEMLVRDKAKPCQCKMLAKEVASMTGYKYADVKRLLNAVLLMHGMPLI